MPQLQLFFCVIFFFPRSCVCEYVEQKQHNNNCNHDNPEQSNIQE